MHPVEDEPGERHALGGQPIDEVRRLAQRVGLRRRDDEERRSRSLEQLVRRIRALAKSTEHRVERGDERLHVAQEPAPRTRIMTLVTVETPNDSAFM